MIIILPAVLGGLWQIIRKLSPQTIRMSVICNWLNERKIPLERTQELAGHKWPGTTEKYFKVDANAERELINKFFPI